MFNGIKINRVKGTLQLIALLLTVTICVSTVSAKNVELSTLPENVRTTLERETKGFELDKVDLVTEQGKAVYKVKIECLDGRRNETVVAEDGSLISENEVIKSDELPASITDAVSKAVGDVVFFKITKTVSDGQVKYDIEADTEGSEITLQIGGDGNVISKNIKPIDRNAITEHGYMCPSRKLLIKLRHQLKMAVFGDSRGVYGINPRCFYGEENTKYPMVLNFSEDGTGLGRTKAIIEDYLPHAANIEWVLYLTSPRIFNKYYANWGAEGIQVGPAYRGDRMGWGVWKNINTELVPITDPAVKKYGRQIGYELDDDDDSNGDDFADEKDKEQARERLSRGRFELALDRMEKFEEMLQGLEKRKIKMLAFTPPIHPVSAGQPCADDDGTTREAYDDLVARMEALEKKYPYFYFVDINNKGRHGITGDKFRDMDHLNKKGATELSIRLNDLVMKIDSERNKAK